MAVKRILAHYMHEEERMAAEATLGDRLMTDSYVIGSIEEAEIPALQAQGLIVETLDRPSPVETAAAARRSATRGESRTPAARRSDDLDDVLTPGQPAYFVVQIGGPLVEEWRERLTATGADILDSVPTNAYVVRTTPERAVTIRSLSFVVDISPYAAGDTGPVTFEAATRGGRGGGTRGRRGAANELWDLWLHRAEDREHVIEDLEARKVRVVGFGARRIRIELPETSPIVNDLASAPQVARLEIFVEPELHNDIARELLGIDAPNANAAGLQQRGAGQIVGIADTGIDAAHVDLKARIVGKVALGNPPNNTSDPNGHGTHVAGSVAGDGSASGGSIQGAAPEAEIYFQSLLDPNGKLGGLPVALEDLFEPAYQAGARIHNNSWGASTASAYTIDATEVDDYVTKRRDMRIVISAGNEGIAASPRNSQPGFVDWLSIGSPASCKNALTVGASRSRRAMGGFAQATYSAVWPTDFPDPPIANATVSGDPECIAGFSSRGPCDDRRIKPDVVAPGTDILSTRSQSAPTEHFWGTHPNSAYAYMGGTSMAAPLVSGCAALVREYLAGIGIDQPSAALVKAILVNGTRWLSGADSVADHAQLPNYHQGFGAIFMPDSIPSPLAPDMELAFVDNWLQADVQFRRTGERNRFTFEAAGRRPLRLCMAYTDLPARGLQNNLNLFLQHLPSKAKWMGNADIPRNHSGRSTEGPPRVGAGV